MEPYHIKHQHQEIANYSEHSFVHCYCCIRDTNIQGLQDKTSVLPMSTHLKLHFNIVTHFKRMTQIQTYFFYITLMHI